MWRKERQWFTHRNHVARASYLLNRLDTHRNAKCWRVASTQFDQQQPCTSIGRISNAVAYFWATSARETPPNEFPFTSKADTLLVDQSTDDTTSNHTFTTLLQYHKYIQRIFRKQKNVCYDIWHLSTCLIRLVVRGFVKTAAHMWVWDGANWQITASGKVSFTTGTRGPSVATKTRKRWIVGSENVARLSHGPVDSSN